MPEISYFLCATPRSGSSVLCEILSATKLAGVPTEHFLMWFDAAANPEKLTHERFKSWLIPDDEFTRKVFEAGSTANGVFGTKMMPQFFNLTTNKLRAFLPNPALPAWEALAAVFPNLHYIHLSREDKVRQAVSLAKATQSGQWFDLDLSALSAESASSDPIVTYSVEMVKKFRSKARTANLVYDFEQIASLYKECLKNDQMWENYFRAAGIEPYRVIYEQFVESPESTIRGILDYLQIPRSGAIDFRSPIMKKQSDALNEEWVQRYTTDLVERFHARDETFRNSLEAYARGNILPNTKLL